MRSPYFYVPKHVVLNTVVMYYAAKHVISHIHNYNPEVLMLKLR